MGCVEPAYWTTIMPLIVQQNFNKTMLQAQNIEFWQSTWEYFYYNSTNSNNTDTSFKGLPSGDFTIELDGLNVTIPREEWIYQAVQIDTSSDNTAGSWLPIPGNTFRRFIVNLAAIIDKFLGMQVLYKPR
jgi:hypothetical protein